MVDDSTGQRSDPDGDIETVLARCIEAVERGDEAELRSLIGRNASHGPRLRAILADLVDLGMVDDTSDLRGASPLENLGPYRVERELGRGGQGIVYLAEDTRLGRRVALKVLSGASAASSGLSERFRREAQVASRLSHPGICTVLDAGVEGDEPWIAMEYVDGETLADRIRDASRSRSSGRGKGTTTVPDRADVMAAVQLVEDVARAVGAAHAEGVIHRDIKPGNIMVTAQNRPVLMDFGLARGEDVGVSITETGDVFGTLAYMAPEQVEGATVDHRCDIWALGVTLYEAVTLARPFSGTNRARIAADVVEAQPRDPRTANSSVPPDLCVVLERALAKTPEDRYATALEFAEDLRRVRAREPILARPVSTGTKVKRWVQRNVALTAALALAFAALTAGLVASLLLVDEKQDLIDQYGRMSDASLLRDLMGERESLWPAVPSRIPTMDAWIARAEGLLERQSGHEASLLELRRRGTKVTGDSSVGQGKPDDPASAWEFATQEEAWRHEVIAGLIDGMPELEKLVAEVRARRAYADEDVRRALGAHDETWKAIGIAPQPGLVPLGKDEVSELWEFWLMGSGPQPKWNGDLEGGSVVPSERMGVVLVLLPGGTFTMGAQDDDKDEPNYERRPPPASTPAHEVTLDGFFMSKYELTQGQWVHLFAHNPSTLQTPPPGQKVNLQNPVESVSWYEARRAARRLGCVLPTEAQWEYAARAGTTTRWWTGDRVASLQGAANIADATAARATNWNCEPGIDDGYIAHTPVGMFKANPFGLHDVCGNVFEWTRCILLSYETDPRPGDGARHDPAAVDGRTHRGGSYRNPAFAASSAHRLAVQPTNRDLDMGVRVARPVEP